MTQMDLANLSLKDRSNIHGHYCGFIRLFIFLYINISEFFSISKIPFSLFHVMVIMQSMIHVYKNQQHLLSVCLFFNTWDCILICYTTHFGKTLYIIMYIWFNISHAFCCIFNHFISLFTMTRFQYIDWYHNIAQSYRRVLVILVWFL